MRINEAIDNTQARLSRLERRSRAMATHGRAVVSTGIDAVKHLADVVTQSIKSTIQAQVTTLADHDLPVGERLHQLRAQAVTAFETARTDIMAALMDGYQAVADRLAHVTSVTHKEQAFENKVQRKARKLKKRAVAAT